VYLHNIIYLYLRVHGRAAKILQSVTTRYNIVIAGGSREREYLPPFTIYDIIIIIIITEPTFKHGETRKFGNPIYYVDLRMAY